MSIDSGPTAVKVPRISASLDREGSAAAWGDDIAAVSPSQARLASALNVSAMIGAQHRPLDAWGMRA
jgi:hypothetical protein